MGAWKSNRQGSKARRQSSLRVMERTTFHPTKVNYRAVLCAVRSSGATRAISINTVGTMSYHPVGSFFLPLDYVEFTKARTNTFFDDRAVARRYEPAILPRAAVITSNAMSEISIQPFEGVYVCAEGPHLESPAQIRMMRQFGDVVGMDWISRGCAGQGTGAVLRFAMHRDQRGLRDENRGRKTKPLRNYRADGPVEAIV